MRPTPKRAAVRLRADPWDWYTQSWRVSPAEQMTSPGMVIRLVSDGGAGRASETTEVPFWMISNCLMPVVPAATSTQPVTVNTPASLIEIDADDAVYMPALSQIFVSQVTGVAEPLGID